ncbi:uncharacterized protein N7511_007719, partial [Penicillium nucicola]|uniref:uncharacterized protein n=1 Tax=Penicillium nucicola TaxID=1850975 RepID=UPI002545539C
IKAPFHLVRFNRCAYYNIFRAAGLLNSPTTLGSSDEATAHRQFLNDVRDQLQLIFTHLKPNRLRRTLTSVRGCFAAIVYPLELVLPRSSEHWIYAIYVCPCSVLGEPWALVVFDRPRKERVTGDWEFGHASRSIYAVIVKGDPASRYLIGV